MLAVVQLLVLVSITTAHLVVDRPRGVALSRASLYDAAKAFACFDGSLTIPFSQVNDDYCDCTDGSDEPGTSACTNGRFNCPNVGHKAVDVPSSRVNDQLCDCCDGSDEYSGLVQCPNICDELGKQAREETEKRSAVMKEGFAKRQLLATEGHKLKQDTLMKLAELKKQRDALQPQRDDVQARKTEAETRESEAKDRHRDAHKAAQEEKKRALATDAFLKLDVDNDQRITVAEIKTRSEFDTDLDGQVSDEEAKDHLGGKEESDLEHFINDVWNNVKSIYKPSGTQQEEPPTVAAPAESVVEQPKDEENKKMREEGDGEEEEIEGDDVDNFDDHKDMKESDTATRPQDTEDEMPPYDDDTQALIDEAEKLRKEYDELDSNFRSIESDIKNAEAATETDMGPNSEWAPLRDQCFELTDAQYVYKLCMFDKTSQKDKNGHSETSLGIWQKWDGPDEDKYLQQKYEKGQSCWNGPERSTQVLYRCGLETRLLEASEPGRCEYRFLVETPVVCTDPAVVSEEHTEL